MNGTWYRKETKMSMTPRFIVVEGLDGAGKTTQIKLLARALEESGHKVMLTAEPTAYESGRALRAALSGKVKKTPCEMAVMFTLDRIAHNRNAEDGIERLLADGYTVISDRYYYSSLAYQGSITDPEWVAHLNLDCPEIRKPDLCIFLDLAPEDSMRRITANRTADELEIYETEEQLRRIRETFLSVFEHLEKNTDRGETIRFVDASGTIEEVAKRVRSTVDEALFS